MTPVDRSGPAAKQTLARHSAGFVASGLVSLAVDAGTTSALTRALGVSPFIARPIGIALAIIVAWACHRRLTFAVTTAPTLAEFGRYATVASGAASVNYVLFAGLLLAFPTLAPEAALAASSLASMVVSYLGMRLGVFGPPSLDG